MKIFQILKQKSIEFHKLKMKKQKKSWHTCVNKGIYGGPISGTHYVDFLIAKVDNKTLQLMRCHVLCYHNKIIIKNFKTKLRKGTISYFKNNGITLL